MAKKQKNDSINWKNVWDPKNLLQIIVGSSLAVFAMKGFMIPNRFMDGGVTGISILLHEIYHINISIFILVFNLPFIYLGIKESAKPLPFKQHLPFSYWHLACCSLIFHLLLKINC